MEALREIRWVMVHDGKPVYVRHPSQFVDLCRERFGSSPNESFLVAYLGNQNSLLGWEELGRGSPTTCNADPRQIVGNALRLGALGVIIAHNHPGGVLTPSPEDIAHGRRLLAYLSVFQLPLLDALIFDNNSSRTYINQLGPPGDIRLALAEIIAPKEGANHE